MIKPEERAEFIGQIIDIFEDFLEEKEIEIPNEERFVSEDGEAIIYGSDYGQLGDQLEDMMVAWKLMKVREAYE